MKPTVLIIAIAVLGCKGKESKKADTANVGSEVAKAADAAVVAVTIDATAVAATDERCASPCRFLADTPLGEIAAKVKTTCAADWPAVNPNDCAQLDYQRNCIFATAGYTFKKKRYQDAFGKAAWYKARTDFKASDLSKTALANVAELKKQAGECRKGVAVDAADKKIVEAWLAKLRAGKPEMPAITISDGDTDSDGLKQSLLAMKKELAAKSERGWRYVQQADLREDWAAKLKDKKVKAVEVDFSDPGSDNCEDECGFGLWLTFAIEGDKIIGIEMMAAACPAVYVDGKPQGEILRTFAWPEHEAFQTLPIAAPCSGRITVRIAEEKRETTYLDELALVVGDTIVLPESCGALCANDGRYEKLSQGQSLEVSFVVPGCGAKLRANGYYAPLN